MSADPSIPASSVIGRACLDGWYGVVLALNPGDIRGWVESEHGPGHAPTADGFGCDDMRLPLSRREVRIRVVDVLGQGVGSIPAHDARHLLDGPPLGTAGITAEQSAILLAAHVAGVEAGGPGVRGIVRGIVTMDGVASAVLVGGGCIGGWSRRADGWHVRLNHGAPRATVYASESEANAAFCAAACEAGYALLDADGGVRVPS